MSEPLRHYTCKVCNRRYEYGGPEQKGYDRQICSPMCDGVLTGIARERKRVIEVLNGLKRYEEKTKDYYVYVGEDEWGDYVKVDDIAAALGITVDSVLDPATGSCRGFREQKS